jgi:hypothetical protein
MSKKALYEIEILPCGKVEVSWKTYEGEFISRVMEPDKLEDGLRELVKAFIDRE